MTLIQLDQLTPQQLIAQYVIECRGKGLFLPYDEYEIIGSWLSLAGSPDSLLLILSDLLPKYFAFDSDCESRRPRSLKSLNNRVVRRLKANLISC